MDQYKNKKYKNMRELVLDTETTGLDPENGDRIVEIGIIELNNHIKTGKQFHYYINPDVSFLNSELKRCNLNDLNNDNILDTLLLARKKYPGQSVSLDTLCRRFGIDISNRKIHGALLDAELLSLVYLELIGGKQTKLNFDNDVDIILDKISENINININENYKNKKIIAIKNITLNKHGHQKHKKFIDTIPNSIWSKIIN
jgi:DNA polymerase-3 subunit epsilon